MNCSRCGGTGIDPAGYLECEGVCVTGHEEIICFATRTHVGVPHMAIAGVPCPECGGHDECSEACSLPENRDQGDTHYRWDDGDEDLILVSDEEWVSWRNLYRPGRTAFEHRPD